MILPGKGEIGLPELRREHGREFCPVLRCRACQLPILGRVLRHVVQFRLPVVVDDQLPVSPPDAEEVDPPADRFPPMVLHLERPSKAWQQAVADLMASADLGYLVVVRVGVSQYPKGRRGVFAKNVLLGTGHEQPVKFLTAEDKLLEVLQVTGLLVDARGRVVRAGAEGILARDTPFLAQSFDIARMLDEAALQAALSTERRQDLPGAPLSLDVAVDNLVGQLLKDPRRVLRPL